MHRSLLLFATLSITLVPLNALAEPDEGAKLVARELMSQGRDQREAHDFVAALESFSKADAIMHVPTTLLEVARAHADLGELLAALGALDQLARAPVSADDPAPFVRARSDGEALRTQIAARLPTLQVDLGGAPEPNNAELWVDGAARPECVAGCHLDPGSHLVVAESRGARAEEQVQLREGETQPLELVFSPQLRNSVALSDAPETKTPEAVRHRPRLSHATLVLGVTSLASLGIGGVLGMSAISRRDDLERSCGNHCTPSAVQDVRRRAVLCDLALGVGVTTAALAAVSYVAGRELTRGSEHGSRALQSNLSVAAAPSAGAYVSWSGAF
jgi:hypothetical protein